MTQNKSKHAINRIIPFVLIGGLILLFFNKMAFSNLILARGDTFLYFYPYWQAAAAALHDGRVPLWNPQLFMGSPFLANSQVGFFYPLNWPLWWLLETPYAVSAAIIIHLLIGGLGGYGAGRLLLGLDRWAAVVTAVIFALGGYVTAQVEHINQLQGLAWLPWFWVVMGWCSRKSSRSRLKTIIMATIAFALLFSLQLLAGHTQTLFITGFAIVVWISAEVVSTRLLQQSPKEMQFAFRLKRLLKPTILALLFGGLLALLVTAVQLLPTLELAQYSSRQGGLDPNEVLSFSLHPLLLTRALLPVYGQSLFSEYVAFVPITAVVLAVIGAWQWRDWPGILPALVLVALGLLLALGLFNPANWLLARLPGFNLFRVPARWLLIYVFGISLLAGVGFQLALDRYYQRSRPWADVPERAKTSLAHIERPLRAAIFVVVGLLAWNALAGILALFIPLGAEAPFEQLPLVTLFFWVVEIILVYSILTGERLAYRADGRFKIGGRRGKPLSPFWLFGISVISLFWASRTHPYNNLTTPEAYFDLRPPIARLQTDVSHSRFLSLSDIFFDVGDQAEIDTIYADQLPPEARYDYTVAIKQKEIIGPNLPMTFGLMAVDGFDGGILPLRSYTQLMKLILTEGVETTDGRLREHLTAVPAAKWLDLFNAGFIITDKTGDTWRDGVFFDRQLPLTIMAGEAARVGYVPRFAADEIRLLAQGYPGTILLETDGTSLILEPREIEPGYYQVNLPQSLVLSGISLHATDQEPWLVDSLTLVNSEKETFQPLVLGEYRQIHSGDVKIYENLDVLPRAFMVLQWQWQPNMAAALAAMQHPDFNPGETAVLVADGEPIDLQPELAGGGTAVSIRTYEPGYIEVETSSETPAVLILTEAHYPGWRVTVDGQPADIYQADIYFQAVFLEPGEHEIVFVYESSGFRYGRYLSLIGISLVLILIISLTVRGYFVKKDSNA